MDERDLMRIVRNMLSSVVDLVNSSGDEKEIATVLLNVRNGVAGFCSMLDGVIDDEEGLEDIADNAEEEE